MWCKITQISGGVEIGTRVADAKATHTHASASIVSIIRIRYSRFCCERENEYISTRAAAAKRKNEYVVQQPWRFGEDPSGHRFRST
jgi:hypothetical protein